MQEFERERERGSNEVPSALQIPADGRQLDTGSTTTDGSWVGGDGWRLSIGLGWNNFAVPTDEGLPIVRSDVPDFVTMAGTVR